MMYLKHDDILVAIHHLVGNPQYTKVNNSKDEQGFVDCSGLNPPTSCLLKSHVMSAQLFFRPHHTGPGLVPQDMKMRQDWGRLSLLEYQCHGHTYLMGAVLLCKGERKKYMTSWFCE